MSTCEALPLAECLFNLTALFFMVSGYFLVRSGKIWWHKRAMLSAVFASLIFFILYLIYHTQCPPVLYTGQFAYIYFPFLILHIALAVLVPILVGKTLWHAFRGELEAHRKIARLTLPIWIYVSASGASLYLWLRI